MRIALAQVNPTVGDVDGNSRKIVEFANRAKAEGASIVVFPEMPIIGYPPKDLLLKPKLIEGNVAALHWIAGRVRGIDAIVGYADWNPDPVGRPLHNGLALLRDGEIRSRHLKALLPTYDVFDESRYFEPGPLSQRNELIRVGDVPVGLSICEDLWNDERFVTGRRLYHDNPIADLDAAGARVVINSSASPFVVNKHDYRLELFSAQARRFGKPLVVVNQVGGNDDLVFDGNSAAFDARGNLIAHCKDFEEDMVIADLSDGAGPGTIHRHSRDVEAIYKGLLLGLRDYVGKCGFKSVVLGLSGGIDSAVTAALAVAALGRERVVGVAMPSRYSSGHSLRDARTLAENLGIQFHVVPIGEVHSAYERSLAPAFGLSSDDGALGGDLTEQNIQARIRGAMLMAFSNRHNHLLLATGNKSELAVGYCTLYGDMCGGLAVISDVPKTMVWELARWINRNAGRELIPRSSIEKAPSAELRPNQVDQDSLPPYPVLDGIVQRYVEEEKGLAEIVADGFDEGTVSRVIRMIDGAEHKRRQAPLGLKVTSRAFGFGRRMPIAMNYRPSVSTADQGAAR